jgi:chromosome segregation ATPase
MIPVIAAGAAWAASNTIFGVAIAGGGVGLGVGVALNECLNYKKKDSKKSNDTTTEQQTSTKDVRKETATAKQQTHQHRQTNEHVVDTTKAIEQETEKLRELTLEIEHLKAEATQQNARFAELQQRLAQKERDFSTLLARLEQSQTRQQELTTMQVLSSIQNIDRVLRVQQQQRQITAPILIAKEEEINALKEEIRTLRSFIRAIDDQLNASMRQAQQIPQGTARQLSESGVFQPPTRRATTPASTAHPGTAPQAPISNGPR